MDEKLKKALQTIQEECNKYDDCTECSIKKFCVQYPCDCNIKRINAEVKNEK